jgi:hypothetical protein
VNQRKKENAKTLRATTLTATEEDAASNPKIQSTRDAEERNLKEDTPRNADARRQKIAIVRDAESMNRETATTSVGMSLTRVTAILTSLARIAIHRTSIPTSDCMILSSIAAVTCLDGLEQACTRITAPGIDDQNQLKVTLLKYYPMSSK